jgi:hypothetical protein
MHTLSLIFSDIDLQPNNIFSHLLGQTKITNFTGNIFLPGNFLRSFHPNSPRVHGGTGAGEAVDAYAWEMTHGWGSLGTTRVEGLSVSYDLVGL